MSARRSLGYVVVHTPPGKPVTTIAAGLVPFDRAGAEKLALALQAENKDPFYQIAELLLPAEPDVVTEQNT